MKSIKHKLDKIYAAIEAAKYIYQNVDDIKKIAIWYENCRIEFKEGSSYPVVCGRLKGQEDGDWYRD